MNQIALIARAEKEFSEFEIEVLVSECTWKWPKGVSLKAMAVVGGSNGW